ncbi:MAG: glycosyltransferase family 9 protein [Hyphomicrobiales bacterium]
MPELPSRPRNVAVLRANAVGDFVFALPALEALRARFPEAELVLLGKPWHRDFLRGRPGPVDRVIALPKIAGVGEHETYPTDQAELEACLAELRGERFDLAVQIHGGGQYSNPFVDAMSPGFSIGLRAPGAAPLDRWVRYVYWQPEILRMLEAAALAGATPTTLTPRLAVRAADRAEASAAIRSGRLVAIHPGAGDVRRRWPPEHFREVARALAGAGFDVAVVGGAGEDERIAEQITAGLGVPVRNLAGRLSLGGLVGLLASARLLVANDSGPLHLAEAVGTPTVGIYWCGNLVNADPMTRDSHRPVLSWRVNCPECGANVLTGRCDHPRSFADLAPVGEVLAHCFDLLDRPSPAAAAEPTAGGVAAGP